MPWLYNRDRDVHHIKLQDGSSFGFMPRKKVYVQPHMMSAQAWDLVRSGSLISHGGDPITQPETPAAEAAQQVVAEVHAVKTYTSSSHHASDVSFSFDSSSADSGKEEKSVKKQPDDLGKEDSIDLEPEIQTDDTNKKNEKRGGKFRRGT